MSKNIKYIPNIIKLNMSSIKLHNRQYNWK